MTNTVKSGILFLFFFMVSAPLFAQSEISEAQRIVEKNLADFNNHDVRAMASNLSDSLTIYSVLEDTVVNGVSSKKEFLVSMMGYFQNYPNVQSKIENLNAAGRFVSFTEIATWGTDGKNSQESIAVYEVIDGKITRVWYYQ